MPSGRRTERTDKVVEPVVYDTDVKTAKRHGNSAHIIVPRSWLNRRVRVILLEPMQHRGTGSFPTKKKARSRRVVVTPPPKPPWIRLGGRWMREEKAGPYENIKEEIARVTKRGT